MLPDARRSWLPTVSGHTKPASRKLYRWVYSREPNGEEQQIALAHIAKHEADPKVAYEDIVWALINTKEFLFNH